MDKARKIEVNYPAHSVSYGRGLEEVRCQLIKTKTKQLSSLYGKRKLNHLDVAVLDHVENRPLAKVVAGVLWGLNKGDRYPSFINFAYLIG